MTKKVIQLCNIIYPLKGMFSNPQRGRICSKQGVSPCLNGMNGGNLKPKIIEMMSNIPPQILKAERTEFGKQVRKDYDAHKKYYQRQDMRRWVPRNDEISNTISTATKDNMLMEQQNNGRLITAEIAEQMKLPNEYIGKRFRIRKLTPRECFRLMDVDEENIDKLLDAKNEKGQQLISNSQLYKMAGNSIVVACMEHIFKSLLIEPETQGVKEQTLF